jgi:exosortase H (IPTLxxWG-CTERM-specific)
MKNKSAQKRAIKKFGVIFVLLCSVFYALLRWAPSTFFEPINRHTAAMLGFLLRVLGMQPTVQGVFVSVDSFSVEIITECSAIFILILFSSFVVAYPTSLKNKAIGLLFGIPTLVAVNTLRLVVVFIAGMLYPDLFEYIHVYFWQTMIIILVFIACFAWLRLVLMVQTKDTLLSFFVRFIAFSSILFLLWLYLDKEYVLITAHITEFLLHLLGYHIHLAPDPNLMVYLSTFNLIAFSALVLATRSIGRRTKVKALVIGLTIMSVMDMIYMLYQVLAYYQVPHALDISLGVRFINQYFLPFGLWLAFTYKDIFKRAGTYICPICGAEKVGIVEHIKVKHGDKALEDERVKAMLEARTQSGAFKVSMVVEKLRLPGVRIGDYIKKKFRVLLKNKK